MKTQSLLAVVALLGAVCAPQAEELNPLWTADGLQLEWEPTFPRWTGPPLILRYQSYQSDDLESWEPLGEPLWAEPGTKRLRLVVEPRQGDGQRFYRLGRERRFQFFDKNSAMVVDYGAQKDFFLNEVADLTISEFEQRYAPETTYLEAIDLDVTASTYWDLLEAHPAFRLTEPEKEMVSRNGFVVTERVSRQTFVDLFYDIWTDDLPVFFSTDAALHAWHQSYQNILAELESFYLHREVTEMIGQMRQAFPAVWEAHGDGPLAEGLRDVDFYLAIAQSLTHLDTPGFDPQEAPFLSDQTSKVTQWLTWIEGHQRFARDDPFGINPSLHRFTDFSQFKVRGHYDKSPTLASYFRTLMWLGRIDFRMGGGHPDTGTLRQLSGAVSLSLLLRDSGQLERWHAIEKVIGWMVGLSDSMTPPQMLALLDEEELSRFEDFVDAATLERLQERIVTGPYGRQEVAGHPIRSCDDETVLPRSFTFFGQRFTPDSWVFSEVTYNRLPFARRLPSSLDVAFSALGNRAVVPLLAKRMRDPEGIPFRDGFPYQPYLAAAHETLEAQTDAFWKSSVYQHWLGCLRQLSEPTTSDRFPQCMRTGAWAKRTLNTQLASWTELRHDTVLYVKQSYTPPFLCDYPAGYVEPRVRFWQSMATMAREMEALASELTLISPEEPSMDFKEKMTSHFNHFATTMDRLATLSTKQLEGAERTPDDRDFMKSLVEATWDEYTGVRRYTGWYPQLYYDPGHFGPGGHEHPSEAWDALVVDVHTDSPSDCHMNPGGVLHQATGNVDLMVMVAEHGEQSCVFVGPVMSYYEMIEPFLERLTDSAWRTRLGNGETPPRPGWTSTYLIEK